MQPTLFNVDSTEVGDHNNETATTTEIKRSLSSNLPHNFWTGFEVKSGPTYGMAQNMHEKIQGHKKHGGVMIFDAVAIKKSWTNPEIRIYEIKQSRSDYTGDKKWERYLEYCHKFYFVCPKDMIKPQEIPDDVGLVYYSEDYEAETHTRIGATKRSIELPYSMFYYVIMNKLEPDRFPFHSKEHFYERFVNYMKKDKSIGRLLAGHMPEWAQELKDENSDLKEEKRELERKAEVFDRIREVLSEEAGIRITPGWPDSAEKKLRENLHVLTAQEEEEQHDA